MAEINSTPASPSEAANELENTLLDIVDDLNAQRRALDTGMGLVLEALEPLSGPRPDMDYRWVAAKAYDDIWFLVGALRHSLGRVGEALGALDEARLQVHRAIGASSSG
jgi:hypothetical protein